MKPLLPYCGGSIQLNRIHLFVVHVDIESLQIHGLEHRIKRAHCRPAGIGIALSVNNTDGYASPKGEFTLTGLNGLSLTGKATPVTDGFNWEIKNSNGITLTYVASARSGTIKNADGTSLGTISNQRASFIDGTFESLI